MDAAMRHAVYEKTEDGEWFASIPGLAGLWATGTSVEDARTELFHALDGWIEVYTKTVKKPLPDIAGVSIHEPLTKTDDD
jgi:predicted RNase H-like HicB family nuclease